MNDPFVDEEETEETVGASVGVTQTSLLDTVVKLAPLKTVMVLAQIYARRNRNACIFRQCYELDAFSKTKDEKKARF